MTKYPHGYLPRGTKTCEINFRITSARRWRNSKDKEKFRDIGVPDIANEREGVIYCPTRKTDAARVYLRQVTASFSSAWSEEEISFVLFLPSFALWMKSIFKFCASSIIVRPREVTVVTQITKRYKCVETICSLLIPSFLFLRYSNYRTDYRIKTTSFVIIFITATGELSRSRIPTRIRLRTFTSVIIRRFDLALARFYLRLHSMRNIQSLRHSSGYSRIRLHNS